MDKITVIHTKNPERVCKTYTQVGDELEKNVIANIYEGEGKTIAVPDAAKMKSILSKITERQDIAICAGVWHNAEDGKPFRITTERKLAEILRVDLDKVKGGVIEHEGKRISARLKRGIDYSSWMLLDADNPPGMPDDWAEMSIQERLELWDRIVPNISKCERIELRGSSARIHRIGEAPQANATHAWIKVSHPAKIETLRAHIRVHMVLAGLSFTFNKISKNGGTVVGIEDRSLFDLAVMDSGRLVFCAKPEVISDDFAVADANVTIVNEGAGALDISWVKLPDDNDLRVLKSKTGIDLKIRTEGSSIQSTLIGELTMNTPIEVRGEVRPLSSWVQNMHLGQKMRCEAPFRVSQSEAAFIKMGDDGIPFVYDIGCGTTYLLKQNKLNHLESIVSKFGKAYADEMESAEAAKAQAESDAGAKTDDNANKGEAGDNGSQDTPKDKFQWLTKRTMSAPIINGNWLIKGTLPAEGIGVMYGRPGCGKSFTALDIAMHIAIGRDWRGIKTRQGSVSYIASEAGRMGGNRVFAWLDHNGVTDWPDGFRMSPVAFDLCATEADAAAIAADIKVNQPDCRLVIVDTLARNLGAGNENAGEDMGRFVTHIDMIAKTLGCFVLVIHHSGKDSAKGSRGHSSLLGAVSAEFEVDRTQGQAGTVNVTKMRDGHDGAKFGFDIVSVQLGVDQDGEVVTSGVCVEVAMEDVKKQSAKLRKGEEEALRAFEIYVGDNGRWNEGGTGFPEPSTVQVVDKDEFQKFLADKMNRNTAKERMRASRDAVHKLIEAGTFQTNMGVLWRVR